MTKPETALRELAEKTFPLFGSRLDEWRKVEQDKLISDLTALIEEHYYPKEFMEWFIREEVFMGELTEKFITNNHGNFKSLDELYQYWKENER